MNVGIILGAVALGAVLLEVRRSSRALVLWLQATELHLGALAEEARHARHTWDRLATRLEAGCEPLVQAAESTRHLSEDIQGLRDRYREGAFAAAQKVGGVVQVLKSLWSLTHPRAPKGAS
ncbi:MAG TPA: hypothetical protein VJ570_14280 [Holophagaceae bacterium]|nr:hypothetical protein [Holophagaceae bacterium]